MTLKDFEKLYEVKNAVFISDVPHEPRTTLWLFGTYCSAFAGMLLLGAHWWLHLLITGIYLIARSDVRKYYRKRPRNRPDQP